MQSVWLSQLVLCCCCCRRCRVEPLQHKSSLCPTMRCRIAQRADLAKRSVPPSCAEYDDVEGRKEVLRKLLGSFDEGPCD